MVHNAWIVALGGEQRVQTSVPLKFCVFCFLKPIGFLINHSYGPQIWKFTVHDPSASTTSNNSSKLM